MVNTQHSDIICPCGGQTVYKQSESKANPGRRYLRCVRCGFLRWADAGEEHGCPICREYKNDDVFKWKLYSRLTWVLIVLVYLLNLNVILKLLLRMIRMKM
ncbi:putative transcription factor GRF family [Helianthus anomalus]